MKSISIAVPEWVQLKYGKFDPDVLGKGQTLVDDWWIGSYHHQVRKLGNAYQYIVTYEPRFLGFLWWRSDLKTVYAVAFEYHGSEDDRNLMLAELRKSQVLNNIGTSALATLETGKNTLSGIILIAFIVSPLPDEGLLIAVAASKGYKLVKAGRTSYHIYKDGKRLDVDAENVIARQIVNEATEIARRADPVAVRGIKAAGVFNHTLESLDDALATIRKAMPDAVELPRAVPGQPYPKPPPGVKKWFQIHPPEPGVGNNVTVHGGFEKK